jgi:uncharacterized protein (TIGR01244 family)
MRAMHPHARRSAVALAMAALVVATVSAQQVTKKNIPGISTYAEVETTIACGGSTSPEAIREIKKMGFKSVVNLRLTNEAGAQVEAEGAAVTAAGMKYIHLPFSIQSPAPDLIDNFIAAVTGPGNQPAYVHCAAGGRAAALWMIKRVVADGWDEARALEEANALGLNDRLRPFALNYLHTHPR